MMCGRPTTSHEYFWRLRRVRQIPCADASFLADRRSRIKVVLGDARLRLGRQGPSGMDRLSRQICRFCKYAPSAPASVARKVRSDVKIVPKMQDVRYTKPFHDLESRETPVLPSISARSA